MWFVQNHNVWGVVRKSVQNSMQMTTEDFRHLRRYLLLIHIIVSVMWKWLFFFLSWSHAYSSASTSICTLTPTTCDHKWQQITASNLQNTLPRPLQNSTVFCSQPFLGAFSYIFWVTILLEEQMRQISDACQYIGVDFAVPREISTVPWTLNFLIILATVVTGTSSCLKMVL